MQGDFTSQDYEIYKFFVYYNIVGTLFYIIYSPDNS